MDSNKKVEFEKAYDDNSEAIFRYVYFRISDRERSKEIMQDVFAKTWNYIMKGNEVKQIKPFLYKTAHNLAVNEIERRKNTVSLEEMNENDGFELEYEPSVSTEESIDAREFFSKINNLDKDSMGIILMRYVEGMSPSEIAEAVGMSSGAIRVRLHRAIKELKKIYNTN